MTNISLRQANDVVSPRPNPQKRNIIIYRLAHGPWWLLILLGFVLIFAITVQDRQYYPSAWENVQSGIIVTIRVTMAAYSLALLMGLIIALLRRPSRSLLYTVFVYQPISVWVELIRGIPTLVLLLYIALALAPEIVKSINALGEWLLMRNLGLFGLAEDMEGLGIRDFTFEYRAIIALAISYSAFLSEVFRAGIESIDNGQREAARSLGMSNWQVNRHVVLPQAIKNVLPPLGNDFIAMLKESSLVSVVGVTDITREARDFNSATFTLFPAYNIIALTYLVITLALSLLVKALETYLGRGNQQSR
ncbi:MAG: amino acid ABC transporter permease [Anaerolineales bacterium]